MTWLKLDDKFAGHPKISPLTDGAFRLHVSGLLFSAGHETDGLIAAEMVPLLMPRYRRVYLTELEARGLWIVSSEVVEIHDFTDYNPSKEQVSARRKAAKKRVDRWRRKQEGTDE